MQHATLEFCVTQYRRPLHPLDHTEDPPRKSRYLRQERLTATPRPSVAEKS